MLTTEFPSVGGRTLRYNDQGTHGYAYDPDSLTRYDTWHYLRKDGTVGPFSGATGYGRDDVVFATKQEALAVASKANGPAEDW